MTDAMSSLIIENAILPAFRRGDFPAGIRAGVRDIKDVLLGDAEEVKERAQASERPRLDTWSVVLIIFWICVVLFVAVRRRAIDQQFAAGRRRAPRPARCAHRSPFRATSGGWGGGWSAAATAAAADGPAAAATSAAAARRGAGECDGRHRVAMRLFSAEEERRISAAITERRAADVRRDRRRRRGAERRLSLRAASGRRHRQPARAVAAHLLHPARSRSIYLVQLAVFFVVTAALMPAVRCASRWCRRASSGCTPTAARSSSSSCRTCTRPPAVPAC